MSLVLELQQLALDKHTDVSELLRKAYAVAVKLGLRSFKTWAECELNGYIKKRIPPYRLVHGRVVCFNPYNGWIPLVWSRDPDFQAKLSSRWVNTPVGVLQEFLDHGDDNHCLLHYAPELEQLLMNNIEDPFRPALEVPRSVFVFILDQVRNVILKWSLKLEADGILGEGLTFSPEEKKTAVDNQAELQPVVAINVSTMAVGQMNKSAVQQASPEGEIYCLF